MKLLLVGDIVGGAGRRVFAQVATRLKSAGQVDGVIVNAENAAGGKGITEKVAGELFAGGADVLTLGDHAWDQRESIPFITRAERIIRPANFAPGCPGKGAVTVTVKGASVTVVSLIGRVFMKPYDCPFRKADEVLADHHRGDVVIVDMHAEATSEKIVMGRYLDGRVSAVVGTHTHVQTSDEVILPGGTAYITDLGMTGVKDSAIGRDLESVTNMFVSGMPAKFGMAKGTALLEGVMVEINGKTGRARAITRIRESMEGSARTAMA